jgi:curli biogenesis system outer membrane secretion channel CsgG
MVAEPAKGWGHLQPYGLGSPGSLIRLLVQETGCFDVVERGAGMSKLDEERARAQSGQMRGDANLGDGQMQVADFLLVPDVLIPTSTTSGGGVGWLIGGKKGGLLGVIAGGIKTKEATTSILVSDVRSGIQVAGAEGKASKTDFSLGAIGGGIAAGGFTSSPEGKVVAASLLDNLNKVVVAIRDKPTLIKPLSEASDANAAASIRAERPMRPGQMLQPKIGNVKVYADATRDSEVRGTLQRGGELVASGDSRNGFVMVDGANVSGWVQRTLMLEVAEAPRAAAAPAYVAPPPAPANFPPLTLNAKVGRTATFQGSFDGADIGQIEFTITEKNKAYGSGNSDSLGHLAFEGELNEEGTLQLASPSAGGMIILRGRLEGDSATMRGSRYKLKGMNMAALGGASPGGGAFSARRVR